MAAPDRVNVAEFYEREVLPALTRRLDAGFPEFGWRPDPHGWVATNQDFTHTTLGVRADRVVCHGDAPRGFLIHGEGPVLWTTYVNQGQLARGREFVEAVRQLAALADLDTARLDLPPSPRDRRARLLHDAFVACRRELQSHHGAAARTYLVDRGIPADRVDDIGLGVFPPRKRLGLSLISEGHTEPEIVASGLFADNRWPGRMCGAWRDDRGRVATLWSRTISDDEPRAHGAPRVRTCLGDGAATRRRATRRITARPTRRRQPSPRVALQSPAASRDGARGRTRPCG